MSSALIDVGTHASQIGSRLLERTMPPDAPVRGLIGDRRLEESRVADIFNALATGTDHFHAFARVVRMREEFGPSVATLARSTIEALGRGWWLAEADSYEVLQHRAAVMDLAETRWAASTGTPLRIGTERGPQKISGPEAVARCEARLDEVRVAGEETKMPGPTKLAMDVMHAADVHNPRLEYSHMSAAAHGEHSSARSFVTSSGSTSQIHLPFRFLDMYAWTTSHVLDVYMAHLIRLWGATDEEARWCASMDRAGRTLDRVAEIFDSYTPPDE